jgi:2-polyprenyl-3-methyl-5-hydroxy-6-metoxy-1,4-benzoquinol methylase
MNTHYEDIAEKFNKVWKFSADYKIWATERIGFYLKLNNNDIFVDIGGGTGTFTNMITKQFTPNKAYCVEPEKSMCNISKEYSNIETICSDAFYFINNLKYNYSKMLFKEVIHHIDNRITLWNDIYNTIEANGRILIYTRPQKIKFPLFQKAKDAFYKNQPPYDLMVNELKNVGFIVEVSTESFTFELSKEEWYKMLKAKFMSDLSIFTDKEIIEGIEELENQYNTNTYIMEDEIIFITAYK